MNQLQPFQFRDMRRGVIRKSSVNSLLAPENSVSHAINVNFDKVLGSAVVRDGTTKLGATIAANKTPLGLAEFGTTVCVGVCVFSGASTATIYYYTTAWNTSAVTNLNNTAKNRFAVLGNRIFRANGVDAMASSPNGNAWTASTAAGCLTTVIPGILLASKSVMLASGTAYPSRIYFSSVIDPTTSARITWNENASTGDWMDVMPDDGDSITGFAETSTVTLAFKNRAIYRLDSISKTASVKNLINVGAPSQEAIVRCPYDGRVYFFTGKDIQRTDGGFPELISRLINDWIEAIPYANWGQVALGTDGINIYASIGDITLDTGKDEQGSFKNVVLKFSPRDEAWSVHSYGQEHRYYAQFTTGGRKLIEADTAGSTQTMNSGTTDNTVPIFFDLQTQEIEMNRAHKKSITDDIIVFTENGANSQFGVLDKIFNTNLTNKVNVIEDVNIEGNFFTFRWKGESSGTAPQFDGFQCERITDLGIQ